MSPTVSSLLCLGLCLSQQITAPGGTLLRPSIRAVPSSVVPRGADAHLYCQGPQESRSFQLWKDEGFILQKNLSSGEAEFHLKIEDADEAGIYQCRYGQGPHWSEFSAPLQLVVTGFFSKPSLQGQPGTEVAIGDTVTLQCKEIVRSNIQNLTFFLLKTGVPTPLQSLEGKVANFVLPSVKAEDAGNYSCIYLEKGKKRASDHSDPLKLEVIEGDPGKRNAHPQREGSRIIVIVAVGCVSIFLFLLVFLCHRHIQRRSSHRDTPKRPSDSLGYPPPPCLTSLPPEETIYEEVSKGRPVETWASKSEDPQGVTYSQLNTAALNEGQRAPTSTAPGPSIYALLALH
ncbi:T-cell-interacting, activating receptor on myeloid cells protein 1-like isoform X1 [Dromiciops gliroides]|uniref:T-cell-interacting, activating receptor on myeloid cells protein 1-like isoform X1 n=1 Tax=Dromiciops gliroides TaxID=33562 RepID=UPI001CC42E53|nr:T-cell-interacting, activating receptor on myeloid cells protein 1-like isoform X1 [Dromiciops gliroides]